MKKEILSCLLSILLLICSGISTIAQKKINWTKDGASFLSVEKEGLVKTDPKKDMQTTLVKREALTPAGATQPLKPDAFFFSNDNNKLLLFVNTAKVWRYNTRGDYWVLDLQKNQLKKLGTGLPEQSLMFAKFSPDSKLVAYVSEHNIFVEDLATSNIRKLTVDGTRKIINGTFDWVYEEEFSLRDGFRWSPDSKSIAYWQVDATKTRDFYMINNTDSPYSQIIPVEYPKVGQQPSSVRVGVVSLSNAYTKWMKLDGDPREHYITRMEWSDASELVVQQLDRKQQESKLIYCNSSDGICRTFWAENDAAWVDLNAEDPSGWNWVNGKKEFLWVSEKDGWRHIYKIGRDGKSVVLLTKGSYDVGQILAVDEANNYVYFTASPDNATQQYLYRVRIQEEDNLNKDNSAELVGQNPPKGTHGYQISPNAKIARHSFSSHNVPPVTEWISLPDGRPFSNDKSIARNMSIDTSIHVEYIKIKTIDNIELDAWVSKPVNFNPRKKYPLVVYVYGEPAATTVADVYGNHDNFLFNGQMGAEGYIQLALDNRGTPSLKGAAWRKAIYRRIGQVNIRDMAMGVRSYLENSFVDKDRVAVWGWSGGGSSTLSLLFQFPDLFKTGVSIAPVTNLLYYDNVYQERYMGLPQENLQDFIKGSPITHAKGLKGNLLLIHGSGDDNVHYSNSEALINELVKYGKKFSFMEYPNRSHSISEGDGTWEHLSHLYTDFIRMHCPPGAKN